MKIMNAFPALLVAVGLIAVQCNGLINASEAAPSQQVVAQAEQLKKNMALAAQEIQKLINAIILVRIKLELNEIKQDEADRSIQEIENHIQKVKENLKIEKSFFWSTPREIALAEAVIVLLEKHKKALEEANKTVTEASVKKINGMFLQGLSDEIHQQQVITGKKWSTNKRMLAAMVTAGALAAGYSKMGGTLPEVSSGSVLALAGVPKDASAGGLAALAAWYAQSKIQSFIGQKFFGGLSSIYNYVTDEGTQETKKSAGVALQVAPQVAPQAVPSAVPMQVPVAVRPQSVPTAPKLTSADIDAQLRRAILDSYPTLAKDPKLSAKIINDKVRLIREIVTITQQDPWKLIKERKMNKDLEAMLKVLQSKK